jgi:outer membrane protein assembly factor BamB
MKTQRLFAVLSLTATAAFAATDWPQWHGPNRDNISTETGLLAAWPAGGPPLAWKINGIGGGFSGVSIANGKIFTIGDLDDSAYVIALDERDGKQLWKTKLGKTGGGGGFPGPRATPSVDGGLVYSLGQYGDLLCCDAATGKEAWRKNLATDLGGKMMSGWGYSESVLLDGDKLLCMPGGAQGTVAALNKKTGAVIWRSKNLTDTATYSSLVPVVINGVRQVLVYTDSHIAGVAIDTGKVLWSGVRKGKVAVVPMPKYKNNHVFVSSGYGVGCNLFKIAGATATEVYANKNMINHHGGVILLGNHLYGFNDGGGWTCMDFQTGNVIWAEKKLGKGAISYADGHFYCRAEGGAGTMVLIEATPTGWKETGRFDQPERTKKNSWPHLVIANGKLYVRDQDLLLCYDVRKK